MIEAVVYFALAGIVIGFLIRAVTRDVLRERDRWDEKRRHHF